MLLVAIEQQQQMMSVDLRRKRIEEQKQDVVEMESNNALIPHPVDYRLIERKRGRSRRVRRCELRKIGTVWWTIG